MRVVKTSFEIKEGGVMVYQMNEYGHQRVFLSNETLKEIAAKSRPDDLDEADAMFNEHQYLKEMHRQIYGGE